MKTIEECVVTSMDGSEAELFPYLPYIVQDIWEIGTFPEVVIGLVRKHAKNHNALQVLDLGCGKGAVSIKMAQQFKCKCYGIDAINEFIDEAKKKAREFGVDSLCSFEVKDMRLKVSELSGFDIIILGAIGPVFGDYPATLTIISKCLKKGGLVIIDDGYIADTSDYTHPIIRKKTMVLKSIAEADMDLVDEKVIGDEDIKKMDDYLFENIKTRCDELSEKYPGKSRLFENYIKRQREENDVLETKIVCSTLVIRKK